MISVIFFYMTTTSSVKSHCERFLVYLLSMKFVWEIDASEYTVELEVGFAEHTGR